MTIRSSWWVVTLSGIVAVLVGAAMMLWPSQLLQLFVLLYGAWVMVDGAFNVARAVSHRSTEPSWILGVFGGLLAIAVGLLIFAYPAEARTALLWVLGLVNIVIGAVQITQAVRLAAVLPAPWLLAASGGIRMVLGVFLFARPVVTGTLFISILGFFLAILGLMELWLGLRIRGHPEEFGPADGEGEEGG